MSDRIWTELDPASADGLACVIRGRDLRTQGSVAVPVGRSQNGSQVFACIGHCAQQATRESAGGER